MVKKSGWGASIDARAWRAARASRHPKTPKFGVFAAHSCSCGRHCDSWYCVYACRPAQRTTLGVREREQLSNVQELLWFRCHSKMDPSRKRGPYKTYLWNAGQLVAKTPLQTTGLFGLKCDHKSVG
ncbi:uncharacterized protein LOC144123696 [Amblyomma americanum]